MDSAYISLNKYDILLQVNKQWGASGYAVTFPIAFNVVYNVLSIPQTTASTSTAYWGRFYITALTKNGFNVSDTGAGSNRWIAIGSAQPQWGTNTIGTRTTRTETYPLPYAEFCLPVVSGKGYGGGLNYGYGIGASSYSLTSVTIANNAEDTSYRWTGYTYIVIGAQQQWGYAALTSQNKSVSTNITMPNNNYIVQLTSDFTITSDGYGALACVSRSTTNFIVTKDFGETNKHAFWLIIG